MKPPVPGEMLRYEYAEGEWRTALFIQHVNYPDPEWMRQEEESDPWRHWYSTEQGPPLRGWWYVTYDGRPTYWKPPEEVYVYDGTRWRRQRYDHINYVGGVGMQDLSVENPDEDCANYYQLVGEVYLAEGENPPTSKPT